MNATTRKPRQAGATLIETLIALLVFAIGMLGIAGLIGAAVKYQSGNVARMSVAAGIDDIAERIRTNVTVANGYQSINPGTGTVVVGTQYVYNTEDYSTQASAAASAFVPPIDCATTVCTQTQRAAYDIIQWRALLRNSLPGGAGMISGTVTAGMDVTVMWFDKNAVQSDDFADTLRSNETCTSSDSATLPIARFCCPAAAAAPAGVRCYNAKVIP